MPSYLFSAGNFLSLFGGADYTKSDGININLWWGLLMVDFGIVMAGGNYLFTRMRTSQ